MDVKKTLPVLQMVGSSLEASSQNFRLMAEQFRASADGLEAGAQAMKEMAVQHRNSAEVLERMSAEFDQCADLSRQAIAG